MQAEAQTRATAGAQTLRRGLAILRLLTQVGPSGLRMVEITRRLALNKTTIIRLTKTLVDEGFVLHDRYSGRYRLGPEAFAVGLAAEDSYQLQRLIAPTLRSLANESGDTVFFSVLHGDETICLSRDEGYFPIKNQLVRAGDRWPLGVGAGAAALLAALPDDEIEDALRRTAGIRAARFPRCTDPAIRRLIRETRAHGYCINPGLVLEDSWAVGAPVYDSGGQPVAAISIAAIRSRLEGAKGIYLGNRLVQASQTLTQQQAAENVREP